MARTVVSDQKKRPNEEVNRGTSDELEILAVVLSEHLSLKQIVMERLRAAKQRHTTRTEVLASRAGQNKED